MGTQGCARVAMRPTAIRMAITYGAYWSARRRVSA
jgi:hypothetical protein